MFGIFKKKETEVETFKNYTEVLTYAYGKEFVSDLKRFFQGTSLTVNGKVTTPDLFYIIIEDNKILLTRGDVRSLIIDNRDVIFDYAKESGMSVEKLQTLTRKTNDLI